MNYCFTYVKDTCSSQTGSSLETWALFVLVFLQASVFFSFFFFFVGGGYWIQSHNWYTDLLLLLPSPLLYPACAVKAFVCYVTKTAQCWGPNHRSVFLQIPDSRFVLDCIYLRVCLHFLDFRFLRAPFTGTRHVPVFLWYNHSRSHGVVIMGTYNNKIQLNLTVF